jgi:hypothetical protein
MVLRRSQLHKSGYTTNEVEYKAPIDTSAEIPIFT